jgi:hypothetical protein
MKRFGFAIVAMLGAVAARAEDARSFADRGVLVPSGSLLYLHTSAQNLVSLSPTVQYFVLPNLAAGIGLSYSHNAFDGQPDFNAYGGSASVGYNLHLADIASLFPQLRFAAQREVSSGPGGSTTVSSLDFFVPVLFHPVKHFFLGIGPAFSIISTGNVSSDGVFTVQSVIGGWL